MRRRGEEWGGVGRSEEEVIYSIDLWVGGGGHLLGGGGHLLGGGGHLYLKILVSAPVPFWVLLGLELGWTGLGLVLEGLGTKGFGVGD